MKYVLVIGDGMADDPVEALGGRTPLEAASKPFIDGLAAAGTLGRVRTCPAGTQPGSDVAILSIFGCDPRTCYTGRGPLEAADQGIALRPGDAAFRCNMITLSPPGPFRERLILSHSAGSIHGADSMELIRWLFEHPSFRPLAEAARVEIHPSPSFRHIAVCRDAAIQGGEFIPPHDHLGEPVGRHLPRGCRTAEQLGELMEKAAALLPDAPVNRRRAAEGKSVCSGSWFWAEGTAVELPDFRSRWGHGGGVVSAVPLCRGIARLMGLEAPVLDGVNGEWDTDYEAKVRAALEILCREGFAVLHLEGPDEATHNGQLREKVQAIQWLSSRVVEPVCRTMEERGEEYRMLILSDHKTLTSTRGHDGGPVPYILYDSRRDRRGSGLAYTEAAAAGCPLMEEGTGLLPALFGL